MVGGQHSTKLSTVPATRALAHAGDFWGGEAALSRHHFFLLLGCRSLAVGAACLEHARLHVSLDRLRQGDLQRHVLEACLARQPSQPLPSQTSPPNRPPVVTPPRNCARDRHCWLHHTLSGACASSRDWVCWVML